MKHGELIKAAVDGKPIQWRYANTRDWRDFGDQVGAVVTLASRTETMPKLDYRIKPEPIPDLVSYGVVKTPKAGGQHATEEYIRAVYHRSLEDGNKQLVRFIIKTDEDGKETKTVEIVE